MRWVVLVALVSGAMACYALAPPATQTLSIPQGSKALVRGAIHVHTRRSDGTGTIDDIAAAASRAGLAFVILTDHGDGAREPERPVYRHGVLCIDAVEISTDGGHLVALDLPRSPYPLGGEARDVVADVARLGGMSIAAHPFSVKPELRWTDWSAPIDGLEWLNGDSEWRDEPVRSLAKALLTYPVRRPETLAALLDRPTQSLHEWDQLTMARPIVAVASADAHARIGLFDTDPYRKRIALHLPGYEQVFRTISIALPDVSLVQDAVKDARVVLDAIRGGRVFSAIDALATPIALSYTAVSGNARAGIGDLLQTSGTATLTVTTNAPAGSTISMVRDGHVIKSVTDASMELETTEAGAYRVEIHKAGAPGEPPIPWIVTNPIYVMPSRPVAPTIQPSLSRGTELRYSDGPAAGWRIESSPLAQGAFDVVRALGGTQISLRYALGGSPSDSPYVALVMPAGENLSDYDGLQFTARSSQPTRISVQLRTPDGTQGQRWHRSVFLDENARTVTVLFNDMRPSGLTQSQQPPLTAIRDVMFVVDTVNTKAGASGQIWIDEIRVGRE